jgi:hypothetical protein
LPVRPCSEPMIMSHSNGSDETISTSLLPSLLPSLASPSFPPSVPPSPPFPSGLRGLPRPDGPDGDALLRDGQRDHWRSVPPPFPPPSPVPGIPPRCPSSTRAGRHLRACITPSLKNVPSLPPSLPAFLPSFIRLRHQVPPRGSRGRGADH